MNWDDIRHALAVRHHGSFAAAGRQLKTDETTIARRVARLEADTGITLFRNTRGRRIPTDAGERFLDQAHVMEKEAATLATIAAAEPGEQPARIRLSATPSLMRHILAPAVGQLLADTPGLHLELLPGNENLDMDRGETDIAIRMKRPEKGDLQIRKLGEVRFDLFAAENGRGDALPWLGYTDALAHTPEAQATGTPVILRSDDPEILATAARAGTGKVLLASYLTRPGLTCLQKDVARREIWLAVQQNLAGSEMITRVRKWAINSIANALRLQTR